ncbi:hypothetical protein [Gordonia sp. CPCC 205333]|uniref:hypothetical protein n=1 Tax=Gordonia sp. CPCC 205333 TaxID=3140790 RepID=UPI003AF3E66A
MIKEVLSTGSRLIMWIWVGGTLTFNMPGDQTKMQHIFSRVGLHLPTWKFFAPTPATTDLVIMYRDLNRERDVITPWKAIDINRDRGRRIVWPPPGRDRKAYVDLAQELHTVFREFDGATPAVRETPIYALTVRHLRSLPAQSNLSEMREFMIVEAHTSIDSPTAVPIFISESFELTSDYPAATDRPESKAVPQ